MLAPETKPTDATAARTRSSNARRYIAPVRHFVLPCHTNREAEARYGETIAKFLARTKLATRAGKEAWSFALPTICVVNGQPLSQRHWRRRRIRAGDGPAIADALGLGSQTQRIPLIVVNSHIGKIARRPAPSWSHVDASVSMPVVFSEARIPEICQCNCLRNSR
jgi:hypothetical protein